MTVVSPRRIPGSGVAPFLRTAALCWVMASALTGLAAGAQPTADAAIGSDWTVAPESLGPGSAFTIDGTVTIDPDRTEAEDATAGTVTWVLTVGPIGDVTIEDASCGTTAGTSCAAEVNAADDTVTFSGSVDTDPSAAVTADVEIAGTIADRLDRDAILFAADTCGTVTVVSGTPAAGRVPAGAATPAAGTSCEGTAGTIEVTVAPATEPPTELPTEATPPVPTEVPTEEPTATLTPEPSPTDAPTSTPTATAEPTATPTSEPSPTLEPTATVTPTATATSEPTTPPTEAPTTTPVPTDAPTEEATATPEPAATTAPTMEPTATVEPTQTPAADPTATSEPTEAPTAESTATNEPAVTPPAPATEAPQPTPDESDDGDTSTGLWIGVGSLLVLAGAAGIVLYQRRKLSA